MKRPNADEIIRPLEMNCLKCGGKLVVYPTENPQGIGYCENCSPKWLKSFAEFAMNKMRLRMGLPSINPSPSA